MIDIVNALGSTRELLPDPALLATMVLKGTMVLAVAFLAAALLRRASASVRHWVWTMGLGSLLVLPVVSELAPPVRLPVPASAVPWLESRGPEALPDAPVDRSEPAAPGQGAPIRNEPGAASQALSRGDRDEPSPRADLQGARTQADPEESGVQADPPGPLQHVDVSSGGSHLSSSRHDDGSGAPSSLPVPDLRWLWVVWVLGAFLVLASVGAAWIRAIILVRRGEAVAGEPLAGTARQAARVLGISHPVRIVESPDSPVPLTVGFIRPRVVLPAGARAWSRPRLRDVLLHELAHIKRRDGIAHLVGHLACAVHWFNPLVWIAAARLRSERERACDDAVLNAGARPSTYAEHLLSVARDLRKGRLPALAGAPMARRSELPGRLHAILDEGRSRTGTGIARGAGIFAAAALLVLPLAAAAPSAGSTPLPPTSPREADPSSSADSAPLEQVVDRPAPPGDSLTAEGLRGPGLKPLTTSPLPEGTISRLPEGGLEGRGLDESLPGGRGEGVGAAGPQEIPDRCRAGAGEESGQNTSMQVDDERTAVRIDRGRCRLEIEMEGEVDFLADESGIQRMSSDAWFTIEERIDRERKRVEAEPGAGGRPEYRWFVDGRERSFDSEARSWLQQVLPEVFRSTGIDAEDRVARILEEGGVEGVLEEISLIHSDFVQRKYFGELIRQADLTTSQVEEVFRLAGREISSDFELAELLVSLADRWLADPSLRPAYVEAARSLDSDFEHRRVLSTLLRESDLDRTTLDAVLASATYIDSDFELAELLIQVIGRYPAGQRLPPTFMDAVASLSSDFEHRRVLAAALERRMLDRASLDQVLESATTLDSDHELGRLLVQMADVYPEELELPGSYYRALDTIGSDFERRQVMEHALNERAPTRSLVEALLSSAAGIDSDHELARFLLAVLESGGIDAELAPAFLRVTDGISSDFERGRVLTALRDRGVI